MSALSFDPIAAQAELSALEQPPPPTTAAKPGYDRKKLLRLIPLVTAAMKGGPGAVEGLLAGFQQAEARKQQQAQHEAEAGRQQMLDQSLIDDRQASQQHRMSQLAQQQADARARLMADYGKVLEGIDNPDDARALAAQYEEQGRQFGMRPGRFEQMAMIALTPTTLERRAAEKKINALKSQFGTDDWLTRGAQFTHVVNGRTVPFAELLSMAGMAPDPNAPMAPAKDKRAFQRTEAMVGGRRVFVNYDPDDGKFYDDGGQVVSGATPIPPRTGGRQQTVTERRQQEQRLDERVAYLLRNPAQGNRQAWSEVRRAYDGLGVDFSTRRDSVARRVEREDRQASRSAPLVDVTTAAERIAASEAALAGAPASPPANRPGATPPPPTRTATRAEVEAVAQRQGVSFAEAKRQLEARGVVIR